MAGVKKITSKRVASRLARKSRIRKKISGTAVRPRLSVFRSAKYIYVQAIDDDAGSVLAAASDRESGVKGETDGKKKVERARLVGTAIAQKLKDKNIENVVFDRNGFIYHGRVKEVADAAREGGLKF